MERPPKINKNAITIPRNPKTNSMSLKRRSRSRKRRMSPASMKKAPSKVWALMLRFAKRVVTFLILMSLHTLTPKKPLLRQVSSRNHQTRNTRVCFGFLHDESRIEWKRQHNLLHLLQRLLATALFSQDGVCPTFPCFFRSNFEATSHVLYDSSWQQSGLPNH